MPKPFDLRKAGELLALHLTRSGASLLLLDETSGQTHPMRADTAGAADGALPVFLAAAQAVWQEASGATFALDLRRDDDALLGLRVHGCEGAPFSVVMLTLLEAVDRVWRPPAPLLINDLSQLAQSSLRAAEAISPPAPRRPSPMKVF